MGIYIDGVFLGRAAGNDLEMLDIERVEVLRGPQGTLFGRNTSAGAVNIITRQPDAAGDGLSGRLQLNGGSRHRFDAIGGVNIPLVTERAALLAGAGHAWAALLFVGSHREQAGYARRIDGQDMGSTERNSGRLSLLLKPIEGFSALLTADATAYDETNAATKLLSINTAAQPIAATNALTSERYDERWLSPDDFFNYGTGWNSSRGDISGTALTLNYDAAWASFKSISA